MAIKNIPVTITIPGKGTYAQRIGFLANTAGDSLQIPFRYPFVDISNYTALKADGFFRHGLKQYGGAGSASAATSTQLNPVGDATNANPNLGYQLPHTEKLVLLVQLTGTVATNPLTVTFVGSEQYDIPNQVVTFATGTTAGVYEVPLYDFGLLIQLATGVITLNIDSTTSANEALVSVALVVRYA